MAPLAFYFFGSQSRPDADFVRAPEKPYSGRSGVEYRALRFWIETECVPLWFRAILFPVPYLLPISDIAQPLPTVSLFIRLAYFILFFAIEWFITLRLNGNPAVRSSRFMNQSFFVIVASLFFVSLRSLPCAALDYPNHLGLDDVPFIGPYVKRCEALSATDIHRNWFSLVILTILFLYSLFIYVWLLYRNAFQLTAPIATYYDHLYKDGRSSWTRRVLGAIYRRINNIARNEEDPSAYPQALFMGRDTRRKIDLWYRQPPDAFPDHEDEYVAVRFLMEAVTQPMWLTVLIDISPYLLTVTNLTNTAPVVAFSFTAYYAILFIATEVILILNFDSNPIIRGTSFFRTGLLALISAAGHALTRTVICHINIQIEQPYSDVLHSLCAASPSSTIDRVLDWSTLVIIMLLVFYAMIANIVLHQWRRRNMGLVFRRLYKRAYKNKMPPKFIHDTDSHEYKAVATG